MWDVLGGGGGGGGGGVGGNWQEGWWLVDITYFVKPDIKHVLREVAWNSESTLAPFN